MKLVNSPLRKDAGRTACGEGAPSAAVLAAVERLLAAEAGRRGGSAPAARTILVDGVRYRIRATAVAVAGKRREVVLVEPEPQAAAAPPPAELHRRFGLTRREAEVAILLAGRLSNREIAGRLCVTEHTARRHTEGVMRKLGVRRRGEIRGALSALPGRRDPVRAAATVSLAPASTRAVGASAPREIARRVCDETERIAASDRGRADRCPRTHSSGSTPSLVRRCHFA